MGKKQLTDIGKKQKRGADMEKKKYPCPVCGSLVHDEPDCNFVCCSVCGWMEDGYQQYYPDDKTGPNIGWTFNEAKKAWEEGKTIFESKPNPNAPK